MRFVANITLSTTKLEKYCSRGIQQEALTLYQSVRDYKWDAVQQIFWPLGHERVVNAFPKYKDDRSE